MSEQTRDQHELRLEKLSAMRAEAEVYPNQHKPSHTIGELLSLCEQDHSLSSLEGQRFSLCGRMMTRRQMGKACFFHLKDFFGKIQVYTRKKELGDAYDAFLNADIGDIFWVHGHIFRTKVGELSLWADQIQLLVKSLHPLPDKYHGLSDKETCYRQRYLDLMVNEESMMRFKIRSKVVSHLRHYLDTKGFMEVETPMLQSIANGAQAKPFETYHNALGMDLQLRIAPELNLKRLVVGGMDRVYEINRNFRNEGLSTRHNPEFTMLEYYQAYADCDDMIALTSQMISHVAHQIKSDGLFDHEGKSLDFSKPMTVMTMSESLVHHCQGLNDADVHNRSSLLHYAAEKKIEIEDYFDIGQIQLAIFEAEVEHLLIEPTFITQYPTSVSPLARKNDNNPDLTDRFELFIMGKEIANGFSELNDPFDQADRFAKQVMNREKGDDEALAYDHDYIKALEYALPPTGGVGIGIDRLVMMMTDAQSIRDVILFPLLRPQGS